MVDSLFDSKDTLDEEMYTVLATVQALGFADEDGFKLAFVEFIEDSLINVNTSLLEGIIKEDEIASTINAVLNVLQPQDVRENTDFFRLSDVLLHTSCVCCVVLYVCDIFCVCLDNPTHTHLKQWEC